VVAWAKREGHVDAGGGRMGQGLLSTRAGPAGDQGAADEDIVGPGLVTMRSRGRCVGWTARVDNKPWPILPAAGIYMALPLRPGDHVVDLTYRAPGFRTGIVVWPPLDPRHDALANRHASTRAYHACGAGFAGRRTPVARATRSHARVRHPTRAVARVGLTQVHPLP